MKKVFLILYFCGSAMVALAQDVIVQKDNNTILSKVLEISSTEVKYKKYKNLDGPTYTISISDIQCINYQNGEKETFEESSNTFDFPAEDANVLGASDEELLRIAGNTHPPFTIQPDEYINRKGKKLSKINRTNLELNIQIITNRYKGFNKVNKITNAIYGKKWQIKNAYKWLKKHWGCYEKYIKPEYIPL